MAYFNFCKVLQNNPLYQEGRHRNAKILKLKSGVVLSIQASYAHYCYPRQTVDYKNYSHFEIGFPSESIKELLPFAEDRTQPTNTVYIMVPKSVIKKIIDKHGGIVAAGDWGEMYTL